MASSRTTEMRWQVVRSLFELLYRNKLLYWLASTIPFAGQWRTWQRLVIPRLKGKDVLETGCGIGTLLVDMLEAGYTCTAIERSPQMVAATRDRLRRHGRLNETTVTQGNVQQMPFTNDSFDSVVSTFPTEYIVDPATMHEMARVLRPGGRVIVVLGASLLPANMLLLPLVGFQRLVYGRAPRSSQETTSRIGSVAARGDVLLERMRDVGFTAHTEQVRGPFWVALLYIGEKL